MARKQKTPLSFEHFQSLLAEEWMLPTETLPQDASLVDDLQIDSLAMVSMMLRFEQEGIVIPIERAWDMKTIGDVYEAYVEYEANSLKNSQGE